MRRPEKMNGSPGTHAPPPAYSACKTLSEGGSKMKSLHSRENPIFCLSVPLLLLLASAVAFADEPPAWLKQAAAMSVPAYDKGVHAVVLHDESRKTVDNDGKITTVTWWAVRILSREGREWARAQEI